MSRLAGFQLESGGYFVAEVDDSLGVHATVRGPGVRTGSATEPHKAFEIAIDNVRQAAEALVDSFRSLSTKPDEVSVEFGVKLSAETGAIIAKASTEANFTITLKWKGTPATGV